MAAIVGQVELVVQLAQGQVQALPASMAEAEAVGAVAASIQGWGVRVPYGRKRLQMQQQDLAEAVAVEMQAMAACMAEAGVAGLLVELALRAL